MKYCSLIKKRRKRNELSSHKKTWRKLKCILLSERTYVWMIPTIWQPWKGNTIERRVKISVVAKGLGRGKEEWLGRKQDLNTILYDTGGFMTLSLVHTKRTTQQEEWTLTQLWLQRTITCQYWFIDCYKCTTVMQNNRGEQGQKTKGRPELRTSGIIFPYT